MKHYSPNIREILQSHIHCSE